MKYPYRKFIKKCVHFHNILELKDKQILNLIEEKFRLNFLKDTIIVEWVGDQPESTLNKVLNVSNL